MEPSDPMAVQLATVRARFLALLDDRLDMIEYHRASIGRNDDDSAPLIGVRDIAHKIAGTAGTLGFGEMGGQAASVELAIMEEMKAGGAVKASGDLCARIDSFLETAAQVAIEAEQQ